MIFPTGSFVTLGTNASLVQHTVPFSWKEANIRPSAKEMPCSSRNQQIPISLTNIILRLFEWLVYKNEVSTVYTNHIDLDQFAHRKGHNSTMASQKPLHNWFKSLDGNADFLRIRSHLISVRRLTLCPTEF